MAYHRGFRFLLAATAALAAACGGGSRDDAPRLVVTTTTLTANATRTATPSNIFFGIGVNNPPPAQNLYAVIENTSSAVETTGFLSQAPDAATIFIQFKAAAELAPGTHTDTITVRVCRDTLCLQDIDGSPAHVQVTTTVARSGPEPGPEAGIDPLPIANQQLLAHNVIDAEYSNALDAIVMVSAVPVPALHVYDTATGTEQSVALPSAPIAVSVAPDGLTAAVAHTNTISIVDLDDVGPLIQLLNVSAQIFDVVLAGDGYVHALPFGSGIRSVNIATNVETNVAGFSAGRAKLHPSGTKVYALSGSFNLARYGVGAGLAAADYQSPNHTAYDFCQHLWMDEPGERIFTACGHTFRASDDPVADMTFFGGLELAGTPFRSLSHSTEHAEVAALKDAPTCGGSPDDPQDTDCYTRLELYESVYLGLAERYSLAPVDVAGELYGQRGKFIFHSADGATRYLISRRVDWPDTQAWLVGEVTVAGSPPPGPDPLAPPAPVITASTEAGFTAAALADAVAMPHDVVDAEFSTALNAIVIASSFPVSAVYIHDVATRTERSIALTARPTAVSVAPDGTHAAVGHDGQVTVLDLAAAGAQPPITLVTSSDARDVVMAGNGYVYSFPRTEGLPAPVQSLHVATGIETQSSSPALGGVVARLHPAGDKMYGANEGVTVQRYSLAGGTAEVAYNAPGGHLICSNVWFSEAGTRIYTACGRTFLSSDDPDQDMLFGGSMELSSSDYRAVSISESTEAQQIALLERTDHNCSIGNPAFCLSHANLYDSATLARTARFSLSPFTVGQKTYPQRGMFVFHDGAGANRYVVSRLYGMPNPYAEFYISRLQ
jgi:hypothetical protein